MEATSGTVALEQANRRGSELCTSAGSPAHPAGWEAGLDPTGPADELGWNESLPFVYLG